MKILKAGKWIAFTVATVTLVASLVKDKKDKNEEDKNEK